MKYKYGNYMKDKIVFLIRHAESEKNKINVFSDITKGYKLTEEGFKQIDRLAGFLIPFCRTNLSRGLHIVSDEDVRTYTTANYLSAKLGCTFQTANFKSTDVGEIRGITMEEASKKYPEIVSMEAEFRNHKLCGYHLSYPGGESMRGFQKRIIEEFNYVIDNCIDKVPIIVTHQSVMAAILNHVYQLQTGDDRFYYITTEFCSFNFLKHDKDNWNIGWVNFHV